jgi:hypothetical protein
MMRQRMLAGVSLRANADCEYREKSIAKAAMPHQFDGQFFLTFVDAIDHAIVPNCQPSQIFAAAKKFRKFWSRVERKGIYGIDNQFATRARGRKNAALGLWRDLYIVREFYSVIFFLNSCHDIDFSFRLDAMRRAFRTVIISSRSSRELSRRTAARGF